MVSADVPSFDTRGYHSASFWVGIGAQATRNATDNPIPAHNSIAEAAAAIASIATVPTLPTAEYLAETLVPSTTTIASNESVRKLLILDLNGTLLIRASSADPNIKRQRKNKDVNLPRLRTVMPRPYMASFAAFLAHPSTVAWLDTMVWSSAQPHSVDDMVRVCFGSSGADEDAEDRHIDTGPLVAVWARDTLGLSEDAYSQKTATCKDLAKVWMGLRLPGQTTFRAPAPLSSAIFLDEDAQSSPKGGVDCLSSASEAPALLPQHSAHTTLLLDDSPAKAHLQPWNHVCIREYDLDMRGRDIRLARKHATATNANSALNASTSAIASTAMPTPMPTPQALDATSNSHKRKADVLDQDSSNADVATGPLHIDGVESRPTRRQKKRIRARNRAARAAAMAVDGRGSGGEEDTTLQISPRTNLGSESHPPSPPFAELLDGPELQHRPDCQSHTDIPQNVNFSPSQSQQLVPNLEPTPTSSQGSHLPTEPAELLTSPIPPEESWNEKKRKAVLARKEREALNPKPNPKAKQQILPRGDGLPSSSPSSALNPPSDSFIAQDDTLPISESDAQNLVAHNRDWPWGSSTMTVSDIEVKMSGVDWPAPAPLLKLSKPESNQSSVEDIQDHAAGSSHLPPSLPSEPSETLDETAKRKPPTQHNRRKHAKHDDHRAANDEYDETLLAVIGVLDTIKSQSNVSAWIRSGGLLSSRDPPIRPLEDLHNSNAPDGLEDGVVPPISSSAPQGWFENADVFKKWAERGRKALEMLGIEPLPGVRL